MRAKPPHFTSCSSRRWVASSTRRLWPERPIRILCRPKIVAASDLVAAASAIVEAIAEGAVTPSEAAALSTALSGVAKAVETYELADRLAKLEEQMAAKG
jgi:hypothetical protein